MSRIKPRNSDDKVAHVKFVNRKFPDRSLIVCDDYTREQFNYHMLEDGQALFRIKNENSQTEPVVLVDVKIGKLHFLRDYDDESSKWDRGQKIDKFTIIQHDVFLSQFDSVANILMRE